MQSPKTIQIEAYNLAEFCQLAEKAIIEGYAFDYTNNANYPTSFGAHFTATMVEKQIQQSSYIEQVTQEPESPFQQEPVLRRGRK